MSLKAAQMDAPLPVSPKDSRTTSLQQHVAFWDRDNDGIIYPSDVYTGFRELGFSVLFSLFALLIPIVFSFPTTLKDSWVPDPRFPINLRQIASARHSSGTGAFDHNGHLDTDKFDTMFSQIDKSGSGDLSFGEMWSLGRENRHITNPVGYVLFFVKIWTAWLLLQKGGLVQEEDFRQCYDGTLFWRIRNKRRAEKRMGLVP